MNPITIALAAGVAGAAACGLAGLTTWYALQLRGRVFTITWQRNAAWDRVDELVDERDAARRGERAALARLHTAGDYLVANWATFGQFVPAQRDGSNN